MQKKKSSEELGPNRRLMYVKMRLAELQKELAALRSERQALVAKRGAQKGSKAGGSSGD
jgi:hypothetical protein